MSSNRPRKRFFEAKGLHTPAGSFIVGYDEILDKCEKRGFHKNFSTDLKIIYFEEIDKYLAELVVECGECGCPMRFIGLPNGVDFNGAATSPDSVEGRFAMLPVDQPIDMEPIPMPVDQPIDMGPIPQLYTARHRWWMGQAVRVVAWVLRTMFVIILVLGALRLVELAADILFR